MSYSNLPTQNIKMIVGLGNPGEDYQNTYHNAGAIFVQYLKSKVEPASHFDSPKGKHFKYLKHNSLILVLTSTYMNESGKAVKEAADYFKLNPEDVLVAHDDVDITMGEYKISKGQGTAGHNGVASTIKSFGTNDFWRLRLGIQKTSLFGGKKKAGGYVLSKISKSDLRLLEKAFEEAKIACLTNNLLLI